MEKLNKDGLLTALIDEKLIDETGTVNTTTVNYISGLYTSQLLNEVWDLYLHDVDAMEELQANKDKNDIDSIVQEIWSYHIKNTIER